MHIRRCHFYPGEMGWGCLEAECRVKRKIAILSCRHRIIFLSKILDGIAERREEDRNNRDHAFSDAHWVT